MKDSVHRTEQLNYFSDLIKSNKCTSEISDRLSISHVYFKIAWEGSLRSRPYGKQSK